MKLRITLFILFVTAMAAVGLFTQTRAESVTPVAPPPIGYIVLDPGGPVNDDFKRGACFVAKMVDMASGTEGATITIMIPGGQFECHRLPDGLRTHHGNVP